MAPVIPQARFFSISSAPTPSSQTLVPVAISDAKDMGNSCCQFRSRVPFTEGLVVSSPRIGLPGGRGGILYNAKASISLREVTLA